MTTQVNEESLNSNANETGNKRGQTESNRSSSQNSDILDLNADMSSTIQCISCNREMPISSESCVCGHVLSDIKSMEGKRYSGYREELYSRLEIRRILENHEKPKRPKLKQKSHPVKQGITNTLHKPQMKRRHKRKSPGSLTEHTRYEHTHHKVNRPEQSKIEDNPGIWYLNPRFNFKDALADINKRLTSQTSFWISL
ncbi:uncharacterized protein LOC114530871 [Dendronephthya gigantea]|uniref:uncharacterized protein LOC114530871 n=1 Tax=Dendronephthya gigantea TaxID=151771 RepID=UPI001069E8D0|nr:uncharacterized protein LOC114530871 [Dendronephthya gigantea]